MELAYPAAVPFYCAQTISVLFVILTNPSYTEWKNRLNYFNYAVDFQVGPKVPSIPALEALQLPRVEPAPAAILGRSKPNIGRQLVVAADSFSSWSPRKDRQWFLCVC